MSTLPTHILKALKDNKTSLGEHPSYPPDEEEKFIICLVAKTFEKLSEKVNDLDYETLKSELSRVLGECKKKERNNIQALEELCSNIVNEIFQIPSDTIEIEARIVEKVDTSIERLIPEKTTDFTFEDIEDMNNLTDEIYKRRMLNALVAGASMYYMNYLGNYVKEIFDINSDLPSLYKKALEYNNVLMFYEKDKFNEKDTTNGGKVDVTISSNDTYPSIKAEGLLFPILLEETIKGLLELAIAHGLPENSNRANYIISKADFKLAELWDMRLGYSLWTLIEEEIKDCGYDMLEVGINFFLMSLAEMDCKQFNKSLQEIFARTRNGKEILSDIVEEILYNKEKDEFDDYIQNKNDELIQINDDDCFTAEELLNDSYDLNENVKKNLSESEYNYHFSKTQKEHDKKPYGSDTKYSMYGRETGQFGSGTYFSTYPDLALDKKYSNNANPNFIKVGENTYRVDFDLYKNLYRVRSKKQGDILYTLCYNLNMMFNRMTVFGEFRKKDANYNNSDLYQVIKANAEALNLKCPSYYELTRMAQRHTGDQSFSTLFMEYNGYNGVNVSGIEYYDNSKHGSVIYDLSKVDGDMEEVKPKSLDTGFKYSPYNDTIAQNSFNPDAAIQALKGEKFGWYDNLNSMPMNKALRVLKNYTLTGNVLDTYIMKRMNDELLKRYLMILYTAITKEWPYNDSIKNKISSFDFQDGFIDVIDKTKSYYWVNIEDIIIGLLKDVWLKLDYNLTTEEENRQKKEYLDKLLTYLKRDLTEDEEEYIEEYYYTEE